MSLLLLAKNGLGRPSVAPVPPPEPVLPFFEDNFEGGHTNPANGFTYESTTGNLTRGTVTTDRAWSGSYGLRMHYNRPASLGGSSRPQVNFSFGRELQEVWIEYYQFMEANYVPSPKQMKQARIWGNNYDALNKVGASSLGNGTVQRLRYQYVWKGYDTAIVGGGPSGQPNAQSAIVDWMPEPDVARWVRYRYHYKMVSALNADDGEWHFWRDDDLLVSYTAIPGRFDPTYPYWDQGYILGSADPETSGEYPFGDQELYTTLDGLAYYDTDPGWL